MTIIRMDDGLVEKFLRSCTIAELKEFAEFLEFSPAQQIAAVEQGVLDYPDKLRDLFGREWARRRWNQHQTAGSESGADDRDQS